MSHAACFRSVVKRLRHELGLKEPSRAMVNAYRYIASEMIVAIGLADLLSKEVTMADLSELGVEIRED